jgi:DNA polymerase (family 10)
VLLHRSNGADWGTLAVQHTGTAPHLDALGTLPVASSEAEVYRKLGFLVPAPEQRESAELVRLGHPPLELVRLEDLKGSLHNHTTHSDGVDSLETMRDAALDAGLAYFAVTEHSQTANYARGLEPHRLADQVAEVRRLNEQGHGCMLLAGVESDILREGELDYTDEQMAQLDLVVASIHNRFGLKGEAMTRRMANAAANPWVSIMGHPTGRLLLGRPPAEYDVETMLDRAAENGCAVELNASPARLDLNEDHLRMAAERGLLVSIAADAHSARELDYLNYGVSIARRAGLRPDQVLNCMGLSDLLRWLEHRKQRAMAATAS